MIFRRNRTVETPAPENDGFRPGRMALLTVDLEQHPDYEPVPIRYYITELFQDLRGDREVMWRIGERGASAYGIFDEETGELVYHERMTIRPHSTFEWVYSETLEARRIQQQRDNPDIL